ncbi:hypothetical protein G5714_010182 [Onychostoma macrolepis]|uniref:Uncharacterized protein n=1 Tax=Onychostoma macrolepis TaxID=369639 RepID=A0A7J6CP67_9TELE|nr:hypothetical protein G5714_010182 [Onychostoma macrolepis]
MRGDRQVKHSKMNSLAKQLVVCLSGWLLPPQTIPVRNAAVDLAQHQKDGVPSSLGTGTASLSVSWLAPGPRSLSGKEQAAVFCAFLNAAKKKIRNVVEEGQSGPSSVASAWARPRQKTHATCASGSSIGPLHAHHSLSDISSSCRIAKGELKVNGFLLGRCQWREELTGENAKFLKDKLRFLNSFTLLCRMFLEGATQEMSHSNLKAKPIVSL